MHQFNSSGEFFNCIIRKFVVLTQINTERNERNAQTHTHTSPNKWVNWVIQCGWHVMLWLIEFSNTWCLPDKIILAKRELSKRKNIETLPFSPFLWIGLVLFAYFLKSPSSFHFVYSFVGCSYSDFGKIDFIFSFENKN